MKYIADFHIHSKYSRSCSNRLTPENIGRWCQIKGIDIVSTADFTHPAWMRELKSALEPAESGLYKLKDSRLRGNDISTLSSPTEHITPLSSPTEHLHPLSSRTERERRAGISPTPLSSPRRRGTKTRFIVGTELSCIYTRGGKCRRVHLCLLLPSLEDAEKFTKKLIDLGANIYSDGRPILGIDSEEILKMALDISEDAILIPAHIWTPWFAVFGSKSGFDSLEECFGDYTKYIYALETGISSDPRMNWRVRALDKYLLVSNSDAHSLEKLGREANIFEYSKPPTYFDILKTLKTKNRKEFLQTIEFFPQEGMYYCDGHRECGVCFEPEESKRKNYICPKCKKPLTIGVLNRVNQLASQTVPRSVIARSSDDYRGDEAIPRQKGSLKNRIPYQSIIPLAEIIAECFDQGVRTKKVDVAYEKLINECGNEFDILLDKPIKQIEKYSNKLIAEGVRRVRKGLVDITPGHDGKYGVIKIFKSGERERLNC